MTDSDREKLANAVRTLPPGDGGFISVGDLAEMSGLMPERVVEILAEDGVLPQKWIFVPRGENNLN